jgi:hypothetical protein
LATGRTAIISVRAALLGSAADVFFKIVEAAGFRPAIRSCVKRNAP